MICIYYAKDGLTAEPCNVLNAGKSENDGSYTDTQKLRLCIHIEHSFCLTDVMVICNNNCAADFVEQLDTWAYSIRAALKSVVAH